MKKNRDKGRVEQSDEHVASPHAPRLLAGEFECGDCSRIGDADHMFNLPVSPKRTSRLDLVEKKLVRCHECAEAIAKGNGQQLGEPGCGVYFLRVTLPLLLSDDDAETLRQTKRPSRKDAYERRQLETLEWYLDRKKAHEERAAAERAKRDREARDDAIRAYATAFAVGAYEETAGVKLPDVRTMDVPVGGDPADAKTVHRCGLPRSVPCCDHSRPADAYLVFRGVVIGICNEAALRFLEVARNRETDHRFRRLLWFRDLAKAEDAARRSDFAHEDGSTNE